MNTQMIKMSLSISSKLDERLEQISELYHVSKSDVLYRAIFLLDVAAESKRNGNKLAVIDENGSIVNEILEYETRI